MKDGQETSQLHRVAYEAPIELSHERKNNILENNQSYTTHARVNLHAMGFMQSRNNDLHTINLE